MLLYNPSELFDKTMFFHLSDEDANRHLDSFYKDSLSPRFREGEGLTFYRVFVGRRCFVSAGKFIEKYNVNNDIVNTVYSDGGMRILAKTLAEQYYNDSIASPEHPKLLSTFIFLYDDILIHGRALGGLLSRSEEIFAETFLSLAGAGCQLTPEQLYDIFLNRVFITTAFRNTYPNLLKARYKKRLVENEENTYEPSLWRKYSYEIADTLYRSDMPNAAFIPAIKLENAKANKDIQNHYWNSKGIGKLNGFEFTWNYYKQRTLVTFMSLLTADECLNAVMTIRMTEKYIIPFIFLPPLNRKQYVFLTEELTDRMTTRLRRKRLSSVLTDYQREWDRPKLNMMYAELLNLILSVTLLRSFMEEIDYDLFEKQLTGGARRGFLTNRTTFRLMLCNYAHEPRIRELIFVLLDPNAPTLFTIKELKSLLLTCTSKGSPLYSGIDTITTKPLYTISDKTAAHIERVPFDYGIESEAESYHLLSGTLAPSSDSLQYFSFPVQNTVSDFLRGIYHSRITKIRKQLSLYDAFAYILQMMDDGCLALTVGAEKEEDHIQCLKACENSLNTLPYVYAEYLPLLDEIERRCRRQGVTTLRAFYDEFNHFINTYKDRRMTKNVRSSYFDAIIPIRLRLTYMMYLILASGQHAADYLFLVDKKFKENDIRMSAEDLIDYIRRVFYNFSY